MNIVNLIFITLTTPRTPKLDVLPQEGSALSSGKGHSPYPRDLSRTLSSTIFYQLNAYEPNAVYSLASALALASASASAAVAGCGSSRLASLASSPRSPSTRIASFSLASPRLARVASLASPHSPSHRLASVRLARLTLASPCLARLTSSLALASHRLARPRLASLASPPRSPFSLR